MQPSNPSNPSIASEAADTKQISQELPATRLLPRTSALQDAALLSTTDLRRRLTRASIRRDNRRVSGCMTRLFLFGAVCLSSFFLVALIASIAPVIGPVAVMMLLVSPFTSLWAVEAIMQWSNRRFYSRLFNKKADVMFAEVLRELARRGDEQALGPLLVLMDVRSSDTIPAWGEHRATLVETLTALLPHVTPGGFSVLSASPDQIQQLLSVLILSEPDLKTELIAMLARCGDIQFLRHWWPNDEKYVDDLEKRYSVTIGKLLMAAPDDRITMNGKTISLMRPTLDRIARRVAEEQSQSQLLRPSSSTEVPLEADQLLRGAMPDATNSVPVNQLLRSIDANTSAQKPAVETQNADNYNTPIPISQYNTLPPNETITLKQQSGD